MQWLDPDFIFQTVLPALNRGLVMSIALIVPSATIGFVLGVLTGVARVFGPKWLRSLGNGFTTIFRGVPLVVQLMILYFGLPNLGIYLEPYPASRARLHPLHGRVPVGIRPRRAALHPAGADQGGLCPRVHQAADHPLGSHPGRPPGAPCPAAATKSFI